MLCETVEGFSGGEGARLDRRGQRLDCVALVGRGTLPVGAMNPEAAIGR